MFCPNCGASNPQENLFCGRCGSRLRPVEPEPTTEVPLRERLVVLPSAADGPFPAEVSAPVPAESPPEDGDRIPASQIALLAGFVVFLFGIGLFTFAAAFGVLGSMADAAQQVVGLSRATPGPAADPSAVVSAKPSARPEENRPAGSPTIVPTATRSPLRVEPIAIATPAGGPAAAATREPTSVASTRATPRPAIATPRPVATTTSATPTARPSDSRLAQVRYALHPDRSRVVVDLNRSNGATPPSYSVLQQGRQLVLSLRLPGQPIALFPRDRIVESVELTSLGSAEARVQVKLNTGVRVREYLLKDPDRLALDLIPE